MSRLSNLIPGSVAVHPVEARTVITTIPAEPVDEKAEETIHDIEAPLVKLPATVIDTVYVPVFQSPRERSTGGFAGRGRDKY